jgi:hypothetical protein
MALVRCLLDQLSHTHQPQDATAESDALRAMILRYHAQGRNASDFVQRVHYLQARWWQFPLAVEARMLVERTDFLDDLTYVRTPPPWDWYVYFHLGKCFYPLPKKLIADVRADHAAMVALHKDVQDPSNDRMLIATSTHLGILHD